MDISDDDSASETSEETWGHEVDLAHEHVFKTPPRKTPQKDQDLAETQEQQILQLEQQIVELQAQVEDLQRRNEQLQSNLFYVERFKENDSAINFYTGFPNWDKFMVVFRHLNTGSSGENITYWLSSKQTPSLDTHEMGVTEAKRGRNRELRPLDEYFLVMCRLRQSFREDHLGHLESILCFLN